MTNERAFGELLFALDPVDLELLVLLKALNELAIALALGAADVEKHAIVSKKGVHNNSQ
jgi:hypothetical protein